MNLFVYILKHDSWRPLGKGVCSGNSWLRTVLYNSDIVRILIRILRAVRDAGVTDALSRRSPLPPLDFFRSYGYPHCIRHASEALCVFEYTSLCMSISDDGSSQPCLRQAHHQADIPSGTTTPLKSFSSPPPPLIEANFENSPYVVRTQ